MAMGTKKETCLHLAVLVVGLTSCLAKRPIVRTVVGGGFNGRFYFMPNVDIFRVVMPDRQACSTRSLITTAFDWKVHFATSSSKPDGKICIDFGHLKLTGDSTKFTINSGNSLISDYIVTPSSYPLNRKSMTTVKCYEDDDVVTLMFHSDCDGNLKDYFSSWTDVYYHPFWNDSTPDGSNPHDGFGDTETETGWETFNFNSLFFFKTLAPFALLIGVCSCYCGVYRRQAHKRQAQFPGAPYSASVLRTQEHMRGSAAPAPQSIAMQPLMGPGNNAQSRTYLTSIWVLNGDATKDRIAAAGPPPLYTDVTSGGSQPNASPRPPYAASTDLPPPPFSASPSSPPAAPPAYHDLFPSNT